MREASDRGMGVGMGGGQSDGGGGQGDGGGGQSDGGGFE